MHSEWKVAFSPYEAVWISEKSKCENSDKTFKRLTWTVLQGQWFSTYHQGDFNRNDQEQNFLHVTVENKRNISTKEIARSLNSDISTTFRNMK